MCCSLRLLSKLWCVFVAGLCVIVYATKLFAGEISPSWEALVDAEIFDRAVEEGMLPANAFCSARFLARAGESSRLAREMLQAALQAQHASARIAAHMFELAAARSISGIRMSEHALIFEGKVRPIHDAASEENFRAKNIPRYGEVLGAAIALPGASYGGTMVTHSRAEPLAYRHHLNFIIYSLFGAKVDLYRMYLYIESATDADKDAHLKTFYPSRVNHHAASLRAKLSSSIISPLNNITALTHSSVSTDNTLYEAGLLPPVSFCLSSITFPDMLTIPGGFA